MVAPLTANVYITHPAALNAMACMYASNFQQRPWEIGTASVSRDYLWCEQKGWDRGRWVGIYTQKGENSMTVSRFGCKIPQ